MRTTVTLDPDVEALIRGVMQKQGISFKQALNEALRSGLKKPTPRSRRSYKQRTFQMGFRPEFRWDKALAMADAMEDEELVRKLELRK